MLKELQLDYQKIASQVHESNVSSIRLYITMSVHIPSPLVHSSPCPSKS